jgi:hypothetical protein
MNGISKIVPLPQIAAHVDAKHQLLTTVIVSGLTAVALFAIGVFLLLIIS